MENPSASQNNRIDRQAKRDRIDAEWASLISKGWGIWNSDAHVNIGEREMLYNLLEDDEHLECLMGSHFRPDAHATGGFTNMLQMGSLRKGVGVATDRRVFS